MKYRQWLYIFVLGFSILITGCGNTTENPGNKTGHYPGKIKVGHLVALDMAPLFIAKEKGFFAEESLDVETIFFPSPGDNNTALATGNIQFSTNPFTLPYFGQQSGVPMRIISSAGGLGVIEVVGQAELGIQTSSELKPYIQTHPDKKIRIGVLQGDTLEMIVFQWLASEVLSYDDVEMIWFNDLFAMVEAFRTKQIDVLSHIKPYTTDLVINHDAIVLTDNSQIWGVGTPNCTVVVLEEFLEKYPATVKAYLKALQKGFQFTIDHPSEAAEILDQGRYYKVDKDVLEHAFKTQPNQVILQPNQDGMMQAINDMASMGYIDTPAVDTVRTEILETLNIP